MEKISIQAEVDLPGLIARMSPRMGFDLIIRSTRHPRDAEDDVTRASSVHGARSCRVVPVDCAADPGEAAARHAADRNGLGDICSVEIGAAIVRVGLIDRRGRSFSSMTISNPDSASATRSNDPANTEFTASTIRRLLNSPVEGSVPPDPETIPFVCFGGAGPARAAALAEACGVRTILIPVHAGTLACVGLLLADIILDICEEVDPCPLDLLLLRRWFAGLMDSAATAVTRQGYDIDDAICTRFVELGISGDANAVVLEVESLSVTDGILQQFRATPVGVSGRTPEVRSIRVGVTIATSKPALPLPCVPTVLGRVEQPSSTCLKAGMEGPFDRRDLAAGTVLRGPTSIIERHTQTCIGSGWRAEVQPSGDIRITRYS